MKRALRACGAAIAAVAAGLGLTVVTAQAAATPGWRIVDSLPQALGFDAVSASGAGNAWVAGETAPGTSGCPTICMVARHWTGTAWQTVAEPAGLATSSVAVQRSIPVATSGQSAWVFSMTQHANSGAEAITAMEWAGKWVAKKVFPGQTVLTAAAGSGPKDVWGFGVSNTTGAPWAYRFTGSSWFKVAIPVEVWGASGNARAGDWVIGVPTPVAASGPVVKVLHWTNSGWKAIALPPIPIPKGDEMLPGYIAAISTTSVWASVVIGAGSGPGPATDLILHWNGSTWARLTLPAGVLVGGLAGDGNNGLWVIARSTLPAAPEFTEHYSGGRWTRGSLPVRSGHATVVNRLITIPGTKSLLAAGSLQSGLVGLVFKYGA